MPWFQRKKVEPAVVQTVQSVEIQTITALKSQMASGATAVAMGNAFRAVVRDIERAFGLSIPAGWTDREIVTQWGAVRTSALARSGNYVPADLREVVRRFYAIYEPVRFGPPGSPLRGDPVALLQSIYTFPPMWRLYVDRAGSYDDEVGAVRSNSSAYDPVNEAKEEVD